MTTATATEPLTVELLVCSDPDCRNISRVDATAFKRPKGNAWCTGPIGRGHKKARCVATVFREALDG